MENKICTKCGIEQPIENYYLQNGKAISQCKECFSKRQKEKRKERAEKSGRVYKQRVSRATEESKELYKLEKREKRKKKIENETPEERETRLSKMRDYNKEYRKKKGMKPRTASVKGYKKPLTPEQRKRANELARKRKAKETPEQRTARLEKARIYAKNWKQRNQDKVKEARKKQYLGKLKNEKGEQAVFNFLLKQSMKEEGIFKN